MAKKPTTRKKTSKTKPKPHCGLVMPIAATPNCPASHWREVKDILVDGLQSKFETELVSEELDVGVIQGRIVNNLHDNPLVVVDISELNANVMFELGLRLAFDKPTVLVKDEETDWKFDISPLETLTYPRDLRHSKILEFKKLVRKKALATYEKAVEEGEEFSQYLQHFKKLERKAIPTEQVGDMELMISKLNEIQRSLKLSNSISTSTSRNRNRKVKLGKLRDLLEFPLLLEFTGEEHSLSRFREKMKDRGETVSRIALNEDDERSVRVFANTRTHLHKIVRHAKPMGLILKAES